MNTVEVGQSPAGEIDKLKPCRMPLFFPVSVPKLVVLSICTLNLYQIYWFYKNWHLVKHYERSQIVPAVRSLFGVIFCYPLFRRVHQMARENSILAPPAGVLAIYWVIANFLASLPDPFWLLCLASVILLIPIQIAVNSINAKLCPMHDHNSRFTPWNMVIILIGGLLTSLSVYVTLNPQAP